MDGRGATDAGVALCYAPKMPDVDTRTSRGFRDYIRDIGFFGVAQQLLGLRSLVLVPLVTKTMGVADYGLISLAYATSGVLILFTLVSMPHGILRKLPGDKRPGIVPKTFASALAVISVAWLVLFLALNPVAGGFTTVLFNDQVSSVLLTILLISLLPESVIALIFVYFPVKEEIQRFLKYQVAKAVIELVGWVVIILLGGGVIQLFLFSLALRSIMAVWMISVFVKHEGIARPDWNIIKVYLVFCVPLIGSQLAAWSMNLSDRYFIAIYGDAVQVGIYSASYNLTRLMIEAAAAIWFVMTPVLSRLWNQEAMKEFDRFYGLVAKSIMLFAVPAAVGVGVLSAPLLTLLATPEVGEGSIYVTPFIAIANLFWLAANYAMFVFILKDRTKTAAVLSMSAAMVNLFGNAILVPTYGILGAAIATLFAYMVLALSVSVTANRLVRIPVDWSFTVKILTASAIMGLVLYLWKPGIGFGLLASVVVGAVIYVGVALALRAISVEDQKRLKEAFVRGSD